MKPKYLAGRVKELSDEPDGRLRIAGVASTGDVDADGESIVVAGWEWGDPLPPLGYGHDLRDAKNVIGRLDSIAELAITAGVWPPAVIVVGEVVALRQRLLSAVEGSDQIGVGTGEQGVATEAELREEVLQMLLAAR